MKKITIAMTISAVFLVGMLTAYGFLFSEKINGYTNEGLGMVMGTERLVSDCYVIIFSSSCWNDGQQHLMLLVIDSENLSIKLN